MRTRRSTWAKAAMAAILAAVPWSLIAANPAQQPPPKRSYDLGARNAGDLLRLDPQVWTDINRFAFLIGVDASEKPGVNNLGYVNNLRKMDTYPKLHQACRRWAEVTFEKLQEQADELSKGEIRQLLGDLKAAVDLRRSNPTEAKRAFQQASDKLLPKLSRWDALSKDVKQDLDELSNWTLGAATQSRADRSLEEKRVVEVAPRFRDVVARFAGLKDRWTALSSDLASLRKEMEANLNSTNTFDLEITLDVGLSSWEAVERAAKSFATDVPGQRKYLTGENYYDDCPLKEGVWYTIQNKVQATAYKGQGNPTWAFVVAPIELRKLKENRFNLFEKLKPSLPVGVSPTSVLLGSALTSAKSPEANSPLMAKPPMQWRFQRLGRGWWRIVNRERGDQEGLDVMSDLGKPTRHFPHLIASRPGQFSGGWWRCVPTGEPGSFRFYNSYLGESQSLAFTLIQVNVALAAMMPSYGIMAPTSNAPEQHWLVQPVPDP